jgi:type IV secretory pathway TrbF-like protein
MLEYYKTVLGKVSFDPLLFRKELRKAFKHLVDDEQIELRDWLEGSSYL